MRTEMREVRIGEWLGPVDWSYDFASHAWGPDRGGCNPELIPGWIERMHQVEDGLARGERWMVSSSGTSREVLRVGMYDGWPHWKPTPTYLTKTWMGPEELSWYMPNGAFCLEKEEF